VSNRIFIIAHAPLATALRDCALHVYPECAASVLAVDVLPHEAPEDTLARAQLALKGGVATDGLLVLTDIFGATPANVAQKNHRHGPHTPDLWREFAHALPRGLLPRRRLGGFGGARHLGRHPRRDASHHHRATKPATSTCP